MENVLVAGANGTTGNHIVGILSQSQDFNPIAMVRKEEQLEQFKEKNVDAVLADLTKDVSHAISNVDKVIFAAGSGGKNVVEVDQEGAKKLMDVSKEAQIKRFVMLSSMGADNPEEADELKDYLTAKKNADEHLRETGLNYVIVRPGSLNNNDGTGKIELKTKLNKRGEISRYDVAKTLVGSLRDSVDSNTTFEILDGSTPIEEALQ